MPRFPEHANRQFSQPSARHCSISSLELLCRAGPSFILQRHLSIQTRICSATWSLPLGGSSANGHPGKPFRDASNITPDVRCETSKYSQVQAIGDPQLLLSSLTIVHPGRRGQYYGRYEQFDRLQASSQRLLPCAGRLLLAASLLSVCLSRRILKWHITHPHRQAALACVFLFLLLSSCIHHFYYYLTIFLSESFFVAPTGAADYSRVCP